MPQLAEAIENIKNAILEENSNSNKKSNRKVI